MKAAVVHDPDAVPVYGDFPEPEVGDGRALVELVGAGIHHVVRSRIAGRHYSTAGAWPAVPGVDAVARTPDGRLVYTGFITPPWGTMAERMAVPAAFGIPLPDGADPLAVAAGMNPGAASWLPLSARRDRLRDTPGAPGLGTVIVLGASGVAGGIAIDNAYALGATGVVAVGRDAARLAALRERNTERSTGAEHDTQHDTEHDTDTATATATATATDTDTEHNAGLGRDRTGEHRALRTVVLGTDPEATERDLVAALDGRPPSTVIDFLWGPVAG
ncbi:MAG: hypothetical protein QM602_05820, partial [Microbacterium sp.]